jgi:hypothetical protein
MINWNEIISNLKDGIDITADKSKWHLETPGYLEIYQMWQDANFNLSSIKWTNYYPGKHFNQLVETGVAEDLGITPIRSWISRIDPGYCAPWHWDVDDNEQEYLSKGQLYRYSVFIDDPHPGHIFVIDNETFSNQHKGTVVKWRNYRAWHAGSNVGLTSKFMYHIIGYKN